MPLKLERGLELFFKKFEANYHLSSSYVFYIAPFISNIQRTFIALHIMHPLTQKLFNVVKKCSFFFYW
jgi:hypothetical protein